MAYEKDDHSRDDENNAMFRYQESHCVADLMLVINSMTPRLKAFCYRHGLQPHDVDDLLQEVWSKVIESAQAYEGRGDVRSWIFSTAVRVRYTLLRQRHRQPVSLQTDLIDADDVVGNAERSEERGLLWSAVQQLPQHQRVVAEAWLRQLSEQQISDELDIPVGTVKSRGNSMRKNLYSILVSKVDN